MGVDRSTATAPWESGLLVLPVSRVHPAIQILQCIAAVVVVLAAPTEASHVVVLAASASHMTAATADVDNSALVSPMNLVPFYRTQRKRRY